MDGFTQGALGAVAAQAVLAPRLGRWAFAIGWGAGMLADADLFIRSASDPLFSTVMHRGFTHALLFIPVGALVATLPFLAVRALRPQWRYVYLAALIGYATHAPLDMLTTYGTQLFWPFANTRVALDVVAIVDPIFTLAVFIGAVWSAVRRTVRPARIGLAIGVVYLGFCAVQHHRATSAQERLAEVRGHQITRGRALPTPTNAFLFRSIYRDQHGVIHADAIRTPLLSGPTFRPGGSAPAFDPVAEGIADGPARRPDRLRRDLRRYRWFTDGFWARSLDDPDFIGDMRITADPAAFNSLWGIRIDPSAEIPVRTMSRPDLDFDVGGFLSEIFGGDPRHRPVP